MDRRGWCQTSEAMDAAGEAWVSPLPSAFAALRDNWNYALDPLIMHAPVVRMDRGHGFISLLRAERELMKQSAATWCRKWC
jgi:hypothetical protein